MPRKSTALWDVLTLPNQGSKHQTPASLKADLHYCQLQIFQRWTYERFLRLAVFLKLTPYELGSIACISHHHVEMFEQKNVLMSGRAKNYAAALVLTLLEAHVVKDYSRDIIQNPFPNVNAAKAMED